MRCTHCGADIPEGMLICPDCRNEVQMVPDYNPLEDVLVREVRGSVEDATRPIRTDDIRRYRSGAEQGTGNSTRVLSQGELERIRAERMGKTSAVRREYARRQDTGRGTQKYRQYAAKHRQFAAEHRKYASKYRTDETRHRSSPSKWRRIRS